MMPLFELRNNGGVLELRVNGYGWASAVVLEAMRWDAAGREACLRRLREALGVGDGPSVSYAQLRDLPTLALAVVVAGLSPNEEPEGYRRRAGWTKEQRATWHQRIRG